MTDFLIIIIASCLSSLVTYYIHASTFDLSRILEPIDERFRMNVRNLETNIKNQNHKIDGACNDFDKLFHRALDMYEKQYMILEKITRRIQDLEKGK